MEKKLQVIFTLSTLISITGSSDMFRVVGDSVQLEIKGSVSEFDDFFWVFNSTVNIQKYYKILKHNTQTPRYKDRVEFIEKTCSLILKNLQKNDSGLYEVKASRAEKITVAEYRLSVFDPVEAPVLSLTESTDTCNITLTCRGHDLSVSSMCSYRTCEEKEVTSPGGVFLSLSVRNSIIICNHSNPASWKQKSAEIKTFRHFCADIDAMSPPAGESAGEPAGEPAGESAGEPAGVSVCLLTAGLYSITLIILLSAVITVHVRERRNKSS